MTKRRQATPTKFAPWSVLWSFVAIVVLALWVLR